RRKQPARARLFLPWPAGFRRKPMMRARVSLLLLALTLTASPSPAQSVSSRDDLLRYIPTDFGLCFVVQDLHRHAALWQKSPWIQRLKDSVLGKDIVHAPELEDLLKLRKNSETYLGIDWPSLRD